MGKHAPDYCREIFTCTRSWYTFSHLLILSQRVTQTFWGSLTQMLQIAWLVCLSQTGQLVAEKYWEMVPLRWSVESRDCGTTLTTLGMSLYLRVSNKRSVHYKVYLRSVHDKKYHTVIEVPSLLVTSKVSLNHQFLKRNHKGNLSYLALWTNFLWELSISKA